MVFQKLWFSFKNLTVLNATGYKIYYPQLKHYLAWNYLSKLKYGFLYKRALARMCVYSHIYTLTCVCIFKFILCKYMSVQYVCVRDCARMYVSVYFNIQLILIRYDVIEYYLVCCLSQRRHKSFENCFLTNELKYTSQVRDKYL